MEKIVFDKEMEFALRFKWDKAELIWVNFEGVNVMAEYRDKKPMFLNYDNGNCGDDATFDEAYEKNKLLSGFIKWDGCMEMHDFTHHFCQHGNFVQRIVDMIYAEAHDIMSDRCNFEKPKESK